MVPGIICVLLMESLVILTAIAIVKREGARHDGADPRLADPPLRAHPRQGDPVHRPRLHQHHGGDPGRHVLVRRRASAGSLPLLFALTGLFILTCLGMGLVVSAISNTQQQASMAGQFLILPNMFFSGFMFPIASMPPLVQKLTYIIPLRYYITIVRGIFLKGVGWAELKDEAAILLVYGVVILGLATAFFRKQVQ